MLQCISLWSLTFSFLGSGSYYNSLVIPPFATNFETKTTACACVEQQHLYILNLVLDQGLSEQLTTGSFRKNEKLYLLTSKQNKTKVLLQVRWPPRSIQENVCFTKEHWPPSAMLIQHEQEKYTPLPNFPRSAAKIPICVSKISSNPGILNSCSLPNL